MSYTASDIETFISHLDPWAKLPAQTLRNVLEKMQPLRYRMGQPLALRDKVLNSIAIIYEGKVRLLGYDPNQNTPTTLDLLEPGAIVGGVNLVRGISCETAIASSEVICLNLSNTEVVKLLEEHSEFKEAFLEQVSVLEIYDLLTTHFAQQARVESNLKNISLEARQESTVNYLQQGTYPSNHLDANKVWFVSSGTVNQKNPGSILDLNQSGSLEVTSPISARLIGMPQRVLSGGNSNNAVGLDRETPLLQKNRETAKLADADRPDGTAKAARDDIPIAPSEWVDVDGKPISAGGGFATSGQLARTGYPYIRGKGKLEVGLACFQMLSKYFGTPFRKEVIRRILKEQLNRHETLSLNFCGAVSDLMGLNAQLVTLPVSSFTRLHAPVIVEWEGSLALLYQIDSEKIVIADPERGRIIERKPAEFLETWGQEMEGREGAPKIGQVLLIWSTKETPQERFSWRWFLPALKQYRGVLVLVLVASFFVQVFALANPLMVQLIIDVVIVNNSPSTLQVLGTLLVILAIFEAILGSLRTYLFVDTTNRIDLKMGSQIIDHLLRLPLRYFERRPVGEISTRINELENIRQFLTGTALTAVLDAVFSVVYVIIMIIYSPLLTLVALVVVPFLFLLTFIFAPIVRRQLRVKAEQNAHTQSHLVEVMSGIQTVKAQNIELRSRWTWQERYARYVSAGFKTVITSTMSSSASNFFNKLSGLLVLWVGTYLVLDNQITLGQLIAFRIIASYVTSPILRLGQLYQNFQETALSLERLSDIVDTPQEAEQDRTNIPMPPIVGAVKYENVSFRFKTGGPLQLNNINLDFPPGTFVGIVGQSGAGKSTLTKLVSRLYEPESGRVAIDGYDVSKVELYSLRRQIGVVPQETLLFDGTVEENIALTTPEATTEEILYAAEVANAHEFIMGLPNGYNTRVGERGASLSGGQRQRIAIARTVLQQPKILVLDEATSALDYATEQKVCINLAKTFHDTTVLFITHRLGTIKGADVIVMMHNGSVVEQGTHEELMTLRGRYYSLYNQQEGIRSQL